VDEKLEQNYERLAASGALGMYMSQITVGDGTTIDLPPLENAHLVYLRQMGYEEEAEKIQTVGQAIDYIKEHSNK